LLAKINKQTNKELKHHEEHFRKQFERFRGAGYEGKQEQHQRVAPFVSRDASYTSLLSGNLGNFSSQNPSQYINVESRPDLHALPTNVHTNAVNLSNKKELTEVISEENETEEPDKVVLEVLGGQRKGPGQN